MEKKRKLNRITEWWRPKAGAIFSLLLFYLALWEVPFQDGGLFLLYSLVTLTGFGLTGYFLNDWADIPYDKKVGKTNLVEGLAPILRPIILVFLLAVTLFPWFVYFRSDKWSIALIGAQLLLQFAYPVPPVRLKNHPIAGILADSLYAFAIPAVLAWHTFDLTSEMNDDKGQWVHFLFLGIWMLAIGIRHMLNHHVADLENDRETGTPNLALNIRPLKIRHFVQSVLFPTELFASIAFFALAFQHAGFLPLLAIVCITFFGVSHLRLSAPFFSVSFSKTKLDLFATFVLGFLSLVFLVWSDSAYLTIAILFVLLFTDLIHHPAIEIGFRRFIKVSLKTVKAPFSLASLVFNWAIYFFRKWILNWSEERNWGPHYPKRLQDLELANRKRKGVVAVFNQNFNKYTETFVNGHLHELPFHVIPFHGWPAPMHVAEMENLLSEDLYLQKAVYAKAQLLNSETIQIENTAIAKRLMDEKVKLILAEFGTMGARIVDVAQMTGIPLIVIFYGYDAWNMNTLKENESAYKRLFDQAVQVIGVSKDICKQLEKLGCAKHKILYQPCYVDLEKFPFVSRSFDEPMFIAVGRFCQTKAPQLSILAFYEVWKKLPNAKLTMIGADDGNGVLESCKTLVISLKLNAHVEFLGSCSPERVREEMSKASIFIQHSVTTPETGDKEGTPVAIMEAMASGLPVIATRHAGIQEMIEDGVNGRLVDEFDYFRMAEEMLALIQDKQELTRLAKVASESIRVNPLVVGHTKNLTRIIEQQLV